MSYRKNLYNPEARKAEAAMRVRERTKDAAYESFDLLKECFSALKPLGPGSEPLCARLHAHIKKIEG